MNFLFRTYAIGSRRVSLVAILWFVLAIGAALSEVLRNSFNNYRIYKYVFWHVVHQLPLFSHYPEYVDKNYYGPVFSLIIAPFAVLPDKIGCLLWCLANAWILFFAISRLKISDRSKLVVLAVTSVEMMSSIHSVQFNPTVGALLILSYVLVEEEKDGWATLMIALGFLVKIYGIAGLLFFVFSKHKLRFALSFIGWCMLLFLLPMAISSPSYIVQCYRDWFHSLAEKNDKNTSGAIVATFQDISVMGMVRRITGNTSIANFPFLVTAACLTCIPLLRIKQYVSPAFRLSYLAIVLLNVVIFSSSAESVTYVIAVPGACIWYLLHRQKYPAASTIILVLLFVFTILSPTDLVPAFFRVNIVRAFSLKALPCFLIWCWLIYEVAFKRFSNMPVEPI